MFRLLDVLAAKTPVSHFLVVVESPFEVFGVVIIREVYADKIQHRQDAADHEGHPPEHLVDLALLALGWRRLLIGLEGR